ncbi:hypothetical protein UB43_01565 [Pseudomonas sp. 21]|nr:hypothetical protein UB43_01565 [Pseudomonas sp. 21]
MAPPAALTTTAPTPRPHRPWTMGRWATSASRSSRSSRRCSRFRGARPRCFAAARPHGCRARSLPAGLSRISRATSSASRPTRAKATRIATPPLWSRKSVSAARAAARNNNTRPNHCMRRARRCQEDRWWARKLSSLPMAVPPREVLFHATSLLGAWHGS